MKRLFGFILLFAFTLPCAAQIVVTITPGGQPFNPPVGLPPSPGPVPTRPAPTEATPPAFFDSEIYEYCGPRQYGFRCNLMHTEAVSRLRNETAQYNANQIARFKDELGATQAKLDEDLRAIREGRNPASSELGASIQRKIENAQRLESDRVALAQATQDIAKAASQELKASVDQSVGRLAEQQVDKEQEEAVQQLNRGIAQNFIAGRIENESRRADMAERTIRNSSFNMKDTRLKLVEGGRVALQLSRAALTEGKLEKSSFALKLGTTMLDVSLSFIPGVGWAKDVYEATTGRNLVTGEELSTFEQSMAVVGVLTGGIGSKFSILAKGAVITEVIRAGRAADDVGDGVKAVDKATEVVDSSLSLGVKASDISPVTKEVDHLVDGNSLDIYDAAAKNAPLGLGSTGRAMPRDLKEQAALLVTRADPSIGEVLPIVLNDKRWPSSDGWQKMQAVHRTSDGRNITIHYVMNKNSGQVDDFKFKD
jgi:hypothetical protein